VNYFPPNPIPAWPWRSERGSRPLKEAITERRFMLMSGEQWSRASVAIRSEMYRNGEPMVCLSCGSTTTANGEILCGH
jgi:hypothetical protein